MSDKKTFLNIELTSAIVKELTDIVKHLDIDSPEDLVKNYLREVVIAARIEQATAQTRHSIIKRSTDLDHLKQTKK